MPRHALDQLIPVDVFVKTHSGRTASRWDLEHDIYDQSQGGLPAYPERAIETKEYQLRGPNIPQRTEDTFELRKAK